MYIHGNPAETTAVFMQPGVPLSLNVSWPLDHSQLQFRSATFQENGCRLD